MKALVDPANNVNANNAILKVGSEQEGLGSQKR